MNRREHWALAPLILIATIPVAFLSPTVAEYARLLLLVLPLALPASRRTP